MTFSLSDEWVWDFWLVDHEDRYHLFFLVAPKSLGDPELRHANAAIGHAVSSDLRSWTRAENALTHGSPGECDSLATWTGSVVRHPGGRWFMFYTGASATPGGIAQSIACATSDDLFAWTKNPANPVLAPNHPAYDLLPGSTESDAFRDPWVFEDPDGDGWHMLITARARTCPPDNRGVIGHARSPDLHTWTLREPITHPGSGFPHLEVPQVETVEGAPVLLFSCPADETSADTDPAFPVGGIWSAPAAASVGPYDVTSARQVVDDASYSGRLIYSRSDACWMLLSFDREPTSPHFCTISDPHPVTWADGRLSTESLKA